MTSQQADLFIATNADKFLPEIIPNLRYRLLSAPDSTLYRLQSANFKSPIIALILSLCFGTLGIDRFYIGDIGLGLGKLLTGGGCGVWTIIDWFLIMGATKRKNTELLSMML